MSIISVVLFTLLASLALSSKQGPPTNWFEKDYFSKWLNPATSTTTSTHTTQKRQSQDLVPVVIVPSLLGSQIEARLVNHQSSHWWCRSTEDWYTIWFTLTNFYPFLMDCWVENFSLDYNITLGKNVNPPGIYSRIPGFGNLDTISYLDADKEIGVWNSTIATLEGYGYVAGKNLRGAPYDWRVSPTSYFEFYNNLKDLIEETFFLNQNKTVSVVSLSMGSPVFLLFLNTFVDQQWKDTYIHSFTSFSGAYGGSTYTLSGILAYNLPLTGDTPSPQLNEMLSTFGSSAWLIPLESIFGDKVFVQSPYGNFSSSTFPKLFEILGNISISEDLNFLKKYGFLDFFGPPGVVINAIYGTNVSTLSTLQWNTTDIFNVVPAFTFENGDGTVLEPGLVIHKKWAPLQKQAVNDYPIQGMVHAAALLNPKAIAIFLATLGLM